MTDKFLNIEIEEPPVELQLSVEMRIRDVLNSNDYDGIKRYCTHLIRHQMKNDVFMAGLLGRVVAPTYQQHDHPMYSRFVCK